MPPELNTARLMAGAGPAPMLQAATAWAALGEALESQAVELAATLVSLKALWTGQSSEHAFAAATPMVAWLHSASQHAQDRAIRATAQAAAYTKALAMTPALPDIATNHITHAVLTATNFLGINLVPIGLNETDYFVRMWNQAGGAMDIYQAETVANTAFEPLPPMKPILRPGVGETLTETLDAASEGALVAATSAVRRLAESTDEGPNPGAGVPLEEQIGQFLGQIGQLSGLMQQLAMPMQQLGSLASQTSSMGSSAAARVGDPAVGLPADHTGQVGLLDANPLSNHPLAGGTGPSVGLGMMYAEALPGAGGTSSRTKLLSQLIDKPGQSTTPKPFGASAGNSALGGAAPIGTVGQSAQTGTGSRSGLAVPALVAERQDDDHHGDSDDQDDEW